jgi:linoleoyl-CoA desaturase
MEYRFANHTSFRDVLNSRVAAYLAEHNITGRDSLFMYLKIALFVIWAIASYVMLLTLPDSFLSAAILALALALGLVGIGFNVQHDGNHGAISRFNWINRLAGLSIDTFARSSFMWKVKHNILHHTYTNIDGLDDDIDVSFVARLDRKQPRYWFHNYQHWYLWALYPIVHIRYPYLDLLHLFSGNKHHSNKWAPKGRELVVFIGGKAIYFSLAFVIPMFFYSWWKVLLFYSAISLLMGLIFSVVFQLAHMVDILEPADSSSPDEYVVHQIKTTANFSTKSFWSTFFLGGLNFQREHHLFPRISHVYYPRIASVVRNVCEEHGVDYYEHSSFWLALRSHYRHLRMLGQTT